MSTPTPNHNAQALRILTYNIRGGLGMDAVRSTTRIAHVILSAAPDVVCLQEVHQRLPWSAMVDQPARLRRLLKMRVIFQRCINTVVGGYGLAIATRLPVESVARRPLPSVGEPRGVLQADIGTPAGSLTVFCTHWGLNGEERIRQAERLAHLARSAQQPVVLCGDLNEPASGPAVAALRESGLRDAGAESDRPTYPADGPVDRIDFIFHSPELRARSIEVIESLASDHYPVLVDLAASVS